MAEVSIAKRNSIKKYQQEKCDRITVDVPKGKRDAYKMIAAEKQLSLSMLIQNGVEGYAINYAGEKITPSVPTTTPENKLSAEDKRLLDSAGKLTPEARRALVKFLELLTARAATLDTSDDLDH